VNRHYQGFLKYKKGGKSKKGRTFGTGHSAGGGVNGLLVGGGGGGGRCRCRVGGGKGEGGTHLVEKKIRGGKQMGEGLRSIGGGEGKKGGIAVKREGERKQKQKKKKKGRGKTYPGRVKLQREMKTKKKSQRNTPSSGGKKKHSNQEKKNIKNKQNGKGNV